MGLLQKTGDFLGISKFGQGLASAGRVLSGQTGQDIQRQQQDTERRNKLNYAAIQEKDPMKKQQLLQLASNVPNIPASQIDPGLNLSNKEILGSAANVVLNVATPGAFKGGTAAVIGKNAALGASFGAASGLEKNRSTGGVVGSALGGAAVGAALGTATVAAKALKEFTTVATPKWLMDKAVKPTLDEARKSIKYGADSFGKELLDAGIKGGPQKLLEVADNGLTTFEDKLQGVLSAPENANKFITKESIAPYLKELVAAKTGTPGLSGDVQRIKNVFDAVPEQMTLKEANVMKRRIYNELRDVAYKLDSKLSVKGAALKQIAKGIKTEIETAVGGNIVGDINKKLSLYGRLENRITDQMARSMRNNSFGLTDAILTAGGVAAMNPVGLFAALSAAGVKHAVSSTAARTYTAQGLKGLQSVGTGKTAQVLKGIGQRAVLNAP